jgi:hypothetical protein
MQSAHGFYDGDHKVIQDAKDRQGQIARIV